MSLTIRPFQSVGQCGTHVTCLLHASAYDADVKARQKAEKAAASAAWVTDAVGPEGMEVLKQGKQKVVDAVSNMFGSKGKTPNK